MYSLTHTISTSPWATNWPRVHRQVFWLSDGQRNVQRIADLLHKPTDRVKNVTNELTVSGYVSLQTEKKTLLMEVNSLKKSFELVVPHKDTFAYSFYSRLFAYYPQTKELFAHTDMQKQTSSLVATLAVVVAGVERGENLAPTVQGLGRRHQKYGAQPEHYPLVGGVLLETFAEYLGLAFTAEMQDAWSLAFDIISDQMIEGAKQEAAPQHN
jgi:methyl-accepting chemotaxis protein